MKMAYKATILVLAYALGCQPSLASDISITATPLPLISENIDIVSLGSLVYRGGLELDAPDINFGGFSSLDISTDGQTLQSYSDRGYRLDATLQYDATDNLSGITNASLSPIYGLEGTILDKKRHSDAEAMTRLDDGSIIVAFERKHRLLKYRPNERTPFAVATPDQLSSAPRNEGIEALSALADGRLLALTQGLMDDHALTGWIGNENGWEKIRYPQKDGFEPAGAATLPSGDVIVLERRFSLITGVAIRLRYLPLVSLMPGKTLQGRVISEIKPPFSIDNMEGIATTLDSHGKTLVYLISDDNFNTADQRTLLLMFSLEGEF